MQSFLTIEKFTPSRISSFRKVLLNFFVLVVPFIILAAWVMLTWGYGSHDGYLAQAATGDINHQINYQGKLADSDGHAINGNYNFSFDLYTTPTGGSSLWHEEFSALTPPGQVHISSGIFSVALGTSSTIPTNIFFNDSIYLEVKFDSNGDGIYEETFSPRKRLTASPYSFNSDAIDGFHATSTATPNQLLALDNTAGLTLNAVTTTGGLNVGGTSTIGNINTNLQIGIINNTSSTVILPLLRFNSSVAPGAFGLNAGPHVGVLSNQLLVGNMEADEDAAILLGNISSSSSNGLASIVFDHNNGNLLFGGASSYLFDNSLTASSLVIPMGGTITLGGEARDTWPSGGGAGGYWATSSLSNRVIHPDLSSPYAVIIGGAATTSDGSMFEVHGLSILATTTMSYGSKIGNASENVTFSQHVDPVFGSIPVLSFNSASGLGGVLNNLSIVGNSSDPALVFFPKDLAAAGGKFGTIGYSTSTGEFAINSKTNFVAQNNPFELVNNASGYLQDGMRSMDVSGNFLYTMTYASTTDSMLKIFDISDPVNPKPVNSGPIAGLPDLLSISGGGGKGIDLQGNYAFLTFAANSSTDTFRVVDVSNPKYPRVIGGQNLDLPSSAISGVDVSGRYAYVASTLGHFYIVDVSNPRNPTLVKDVDTGTGSAWWTIKEVNNYVYLIGRNAGPTDNFRIYDVSDPANPVEVGGNSLNLGEGGWSMDVVGRYAYLAAGGSFTTSTDSKFKIIDVSDPANPVVAGQAFLSEGAANYIRVYGKYAFITDWYHTIYMVDCSSSTQPVVVSQTTIGNGPLALAVVDNYVYVGKAPIPRNGDYFDVYRVNGVNAVSGAFGSLTAGKLFVRDELTVDKRLRVLDGMSLGNNGMYSEGALIVVSTSTSMFNGSLEVAADSAYRYNGIKLAYGSTTLSNYFFGDAGNATMTGIFNTAIGSQSLRSNTTGYNNVANGAGTLLSNLSGYENTAIGNDALMLNTSGYHNTANGKDALASNTTGYENTALGAFALNLNQTGYAIRRSALKVCSLILERIILPLAISLYMVTLAYIMWPWVIMFYTIIRATGI